MSDLEENKPLNSANIVAEVDEDLKPKPPPRLAPSSDQIATPKRIVATQ